MCEGKGDVIQRRDLGEKRGEIKPNFYPTLSKGLVYSIGYQHNEDMKNQNKKLKQFFSKYSNKYGTFLFLLSFESKL